MHGNISFGTLVERWLCVMNFIVKFGTLETFNVAHKPLFLRFFAFGFVFQTAVLIVSRYSISFTKHTQPVIMKMKSVFTIGISRTSHCSGLQRTLTVIQVVNLIYNLRPSFDSFEASVFFFFHSISVSLQLKVM